MKAISLRVPDEVHEVLQYQSIVEGESMNKVIQHAIEVYLDLFSSEDLESVKQAVTKARAKGRRSIESSTELARLAAKLDDSEGLGPIRATSRTQRP
jgi:predicted DNA-binding protein